ncbi:hypothetical protein NM688_g6822 [Phlebia brevispora]|uniref:Uncharacterized protein n=1 Tax=Phlebia brevispora TaxID=194682 RepID=A0ACC1SC29_9APHY|nr:hypothetical protein NM688_g6822 [Phlebia brevispora]
MDANELGRWTRFAAKGGIGKCTATQDCIAEGAEDLMFMKDDEIVVLMQIPAQEDMYLGYCEGVVGKFHGADVRFHGRLKRPVMTKRSSRSLSRSSSRPSSSQSATAPPMVSRDSLSAAPGHGHSQPQSTSPSLSLPTPPSRMSYSYSAASISVTDEASLSTSMSQGGTTSAVSSPPLPSSPHLPAPNTHSQSTHEEDAHLRSASHSSGSTALDSAPRTPADFGKEGLGESMDHSGLVRIVSLSRQVDSPTELHDEGALKFPLRRELSVDTQKAVSGDGRRSSSEETRVPSMQNSPSLESVKEQPSLEKGEESTERSSYAETDTDDVSSRISVALSDGEVGIGLSLLNDLAGDGDDASSTYSSVNRRSFADQHPSIAHDNSQAEVEDPHINIQASRPIGLAPIYQAWVSDWKNRAHHLLHHCAVLHVRLCVLLSAIRNTEGRNGRARRTFTTTTVIHAIP